MSNEFDEYSGEYVRHAREMLEHLAQGNDVEAERCLDRITRLRERSLFQELGRLTREFHEALNSLRLDSRITDWAENTIPDARERLNYVITMTEQAADRTLTVVEEAMPMCQELASQASALGQQWERFVRRELDPNEFRAMAHELRRFLGELTGGGGRMHDNLNDILMAQDFQDLTGQIIRQVIHMVDRIELELVELVRVSGKGDAEAGTAPAEEVVMPGGLAPPGGGGGEAAGAVSGQDEVDDLLSSLGF